MKTATQTWGSIDIIAATQTKDASYWYDYSSSDLKQYWYDYMNINIQNTNTKI